ncbi:MAG: long-chain-fatty-acid--CoA ligase [Burkholderiaceae bacterium]|nr:long-chain-fatty-acid--CoA ligase [Burkholderiaceae bacterium]
MTLDEIVARNGLRFPDKPALVMGERSITWRQLDQRVDRVANALRARGLSAGDLVAILLTNSIEMIEIYFGVARAGSIAVPLNYRLNGNELSEILGNARPALLVCGSTLVEKVADSEPALSRWIVGQASAPGADSYEAVVGEASAERIAAIDRESEPFAVFFTSGTTGAPKGVMVSHRNLEANAFNQFVADESRRDDVNLISTPLYYAGAVFMSVTYMMLGCTQVIMDGFDPGRWLELVRRHKVSVALLVPTMINSVLNHRDLDTFDLSTLRRVFYGGGPMPPTVLRRALGRLRCGFTQGYGLTETLEATFLVASDHVLDGNAQQEKRLSSAGREAVGAEVRVVDGAGSEVPAGVVGEVLVRSRSVCAGYWNNPTETARAFLDDWFRTGDLGYLDEERYLFIVDRIKDVVVSGGTNIYTKEVESVLYEHPAVLEAAVVGLPDDEWGEIVAAVVVRRPGKSVSAEEIVAWCRESLSGYKKPRAVHFLDELPKNPSGKVLKRELRSMLGRRAMP